MAITKPFSGNKKAKAMEILRPLSGIKNKET